MDEQNNQDHDILSQVKRIQQQLGFLEKKIDMLLQQQPAQKPFSKPFGKPFSKPFDRGFRKPFQGSGDRGRPDFRRFDRKEGEGQPRQEGGQGGQGQQSEQRGGGGFKKFGKGRAKPFFKGKKDRPF